MKQFHIALEEKSPRGKITLKLYSGNRQFSKAKSKARIYANKDLAEQIASGLRANLPEAVIITVVEA